MSNTQSPSYVAIGKTATRKRRNAKLEPIRAYQKRLYKIPVTAQAVGKSFVEVVEERAASESWRPTARLARELVASEGWPPAPDFAPETFQDIEEMENIAGDYNARERGALSALWMLAIMEVRKTVCPRKGK
jgi:hypothetical protein